MASIVQPIGKQTASIIFLHGLGDSGHGWADILSRYKPKYAKLICPHAPEIPVTLNGGYRMPAWWDIKTLDILEGSQDEEGIKKCAIEIDDLIRTEVNSGIPANRIVLGGFSQGAATALYTGLTGRFKLAGLLALSGCLPLHKTINWTTVHKLPIFQCHGTADTVLPYLLGEMTRDILQAHIPDYTFKAYEGLPHSSSEPELEDVSKFLKRLLPKVDVEPESKTIHL